MSKIRKAATVVLLREGESGRIETLLLKRSGHGFFGNLWVFPGGAVDRQDIGRTTTEQEAARFAAVRETREEAGVTIETRDLLPFAHWTPPEEIPSRYATWFFIFRVVSQLSIKIDRHEISDYNWLTAHEALALHHAGELAMAPPTVVTLTELSKLSSSDEAFAFYRTRGIFRYSPRIFKDGQETVMLYQGDAGYTAGNPGVPGNRNRSYLKQGICTYEFALKEN